MAYTTPRGTLALIAGVLLSGSALAQTEQAPTLRAPSFDEGPAPRTYVWAEETPATSAVVSDTFFTEDFSDGLTGWTRTTAGSDSYEGELWIARPEGSPLLDTIGGQFYRQRFNSPTSLNGFALINVDSLVGLAGGVDDNPINRQLTSPTIDLSGASPDSIQAVYFNMAYRFCCQDNDTRSDNQAYVLFSGDGGATFPDSTLLAPDLEINDHYFGIFRYQDGSIRSGGVNYVRIPTKYNGNANFRMRFVYAGYYYALAIDDIYITGAPTLDLRLNPNFYARPENYATPVAQVLGRNQKLYFLTDVDNRGIDSQDVKLSITIFDETNADANNDPIQIYTDTLDYGRIANDTLIENQPFDVAFDIPQEVGKYFGVYRIFLPDGDFSFPDNRVFFDFEVTENAFQRSEGRDGVQAYVAPENQTFGNIYYTPTLEDGRSVTIDSLTTEFRIRGIGGDDGSEITTITTGVWGFRGDLDGNGAVRLPGRNVPADSAEVVLLGENFIEFTGESRDGDYSITVAADEDAGSVVLPADGGFVGFATTVNYVQAKVPGSVENTFFIAQGVERYGGREVATIVLDLDAPLSSFLLLPNFQSGFFGYDAIDEPFVIGAVVTTEPASGTRSQALEVERFVVSPNPAETEFNLDYDFGAQAQDISFEITNALGQSVRTFARQGLTAGKLNVPVADLNVGLYYVTATTADNRSVTRRILIQR